MLEPMNPADRKAVHDPVASIDGVRRFSEGEEPNRSVVIALAPGVKPTGGGASNDAGASAADEDTVGEAEEDTDGEGESVSEAPDVDEEASDED